MNYVKFAWKNLRRHRVRSVLTVLGIAISALTLFVILSFNSGYDKALQAEMESSGVHLYISMEGCPMQAASLILHGGEIPTYLDEQMLAEAQVLTDVKTAGGMLIQTVVRGNKADLFYGISRQIKDLKPTWKLKGSWFKGYDSVILGHDVAEELGKKPGDTVRIESLGRDFKVSGVLEKSSNEDDGFYFLPLKTAQDIFKRPHQLTMIGIQLKDPSRIPKVQLELERKGAYVVPAGDIADLVADLVGNTKSMMFAIMAVVLIVAGIGVFNTVLMAAFERNAEFGYLRCIGAQRTHIFGLIMLETVLLCAAGIVVGCVAGFGLSFIVDGWMRAFVAYAPAGRLLRPDIAGLAVTSGVVMVMGAVAGLYPGFRASRVSPMEAARDE